MTTLQQGVIVVAYPGLLFSVQILRAENGLRMSILRAKNALLLTSGGKRPGVGAIKLKNERPHRTDFP